MPSSKSSSNRYVTAEIITSEEDIKNIKLKLKKFSRKFYWTTLTPDDFKYIINFATLIMYKHFKIDNSKTYTLATIKRYLTSSMITAFWISYKFLADEDSIGATDLKYIFKRLKPDDKYNFKSKDFLTRERELLKTINYDLFKLLKEFELDQTIKLE